MGQDRAHEPRGAERTHAPRERSRPAVDPGATASPVHTKILSLQRTAGNRAVSELIGRGRQRHHAVPIQRLSLNKTRWDDATSAKVSSGGAVGVLFLDDGSGPVVVKAGEAFDIEAGVAASMLTDATRGESKGWKASAPEARPIDTAESKKIHAKASELLQPELDAADPDDSRAQLRKRRAERILDDLGAGNGVVVYGFARGEGLGTLMAEKKQTKRSGFLGLKRAVRKDSAAFTLMNDPGLMTMMGRASAADVFLGNADRFVGKVNFDNVMVDLAAKHISLIDNVELGDPSVLRDLPQFNTSGQQGFEQWAKFDIRKRLAAGDYDAMAATVIERIRAELGKGPTMRKLDQQAVLRSFDKRRRDMTAWFKEGLIQGTLSIRTGLLENVSTLTANIGPAHREQVMTNLLARGYFIQGDDTNAAWKNAKELAHLLGGSVKMPKLPDVPQGSPKARIGVGV